MLVAGWRAAGAAAQSTEDLEAFIRARMESAQVPGLSLAIVRDGKLAHAAGIGFANLAQRRPMRADTLINVASLTKTATCAAVMQLWEQKKFALDDDVNGYLTFVVRNPDHPQSPVTFRHLLTHASSIADGPAYEQSYACGDSRVELGRWLAGYLVPGGAHYDAQRNYLRREPGAQFKYSNVAYGLLGHLVERISAQTYSDYMIGRIFTPLGMANSRILVNGMDPLSHATAYAYVKEADAGALRLRDPAWGPAGSGGDVLVPLCLYSFATPPDGLLRTSALEMSRFLRAWMSGGELDGRRVLQPGTVDQILSASGDRHSAAEGTLASFRQGLAWRRSEDFAQGTVWWHTGGDPGVATLMMFRPGDRRGVVILTNGSRGHRLAADVARRVFVD